MRNDPVVEEVRRVRERHAANTNTISMRSARRYEKTSAGVDGRSCHYIPRNHSPGRKPGEPNQPFQATAKSGPRLNGIAFGLSDRLM